jgi:hypothetical protein
MNQRCCVIREGKGMYVPREELTAKELADVEVGERSLLARKRFAVLLRYALRAEDAPVKSAPDSKLAPKGE